MNSYKFVNNRRCKYFPCHEGIKKSEFNCLFCFCPLYALGDNCKGNFRRTEDGTKDCSACTIPHRKESYEYMMEKSIGIVEMVRNNWLGEQDE